MITINRPVIRLIATAIVWALALTSIPGLSAQAASERTESGVSQHAKAFSVAVKRDSLAVAAACKEGAHRVAVAARAVAHEVATAAKRGSAETRAAFQGDKLDTPAG